jgi:plasmid stability protein
MTALQIRNLPDDVHRRLKARAAERGQSLSEYAAGVLRREAEKLSIDELWERIQARGPAGDIEPGEIARVIRAERESR